ncbi:MAG: SDR family oxidoreductase [Chlorobi bacterium]|nr:MAG: SDR family oxidoreductase [Bacteroidota bacterium]KXK35954.1 MAG: 3-ketoacyl-(acyl-carrier-protein) reductase [Chlorobi bacterium OLB6]MBE2265990.1 SDR family oxidoreductase [Flavobacteriales bacterium]MBL1161432.1 SDR family oxidoreductase [Chlorobiota bacterium]MBW7854011.1 SDR family oxidoreductase [Candidatus Kapabacteria bacterium]MCC6331896.1 SDR family oxidoreductase [Ignavibacteria bacterium]
MTKKVAIVTGAAKGIGMAITKRFVKEGYTVVAVDVDGEAGERLVALLGDHGVQYVNANVTREDDVHQLFTSTLDKYGVIDVVVNNAGIIRDGVIWKQTLDDFNAVIDVNLKGVWLMCREAATVMRSQKSGRIVNISSRAWLGNPGQSNYSASKAGVVALTRVLALELGRYNVMVNAVAPGLIDTPLTTALSDDVREKLIQAQPTKSMGSPDDVANAVFFLACDSTGFITGQTLYVDGGKSIGAGI